MANRFRDKFMRQQYDGAMLAFRTKHRDLFDAAGNRRQPGSSFAGFFWRGYDGVTGGLCDFTSREARSTCAYAYWCAGRDAKKLDAQSTTRLAR